MSIPDYQSFMLPLLHVAADGEIHALRETFDTLADQIGLTEDERNELLPSGTQQTFKNRIAWARTYLTKAGLLESPKRGHFRITGHGKNLLSENPPSLSISELQKYESFREFRDRSNKQSAVNESQPELINSTTPEESIENAIEELNDQLATEILQSVMSASPEFFERVVIQLLVRMGYGGTLREAAQVVGRSGDGGIDGIIKEDRLGLEVIYVQAKRWENPVSRPEIQKFVGALQGRRARKGIFLTTSRYTQEAREYVTMIENRVVLIDGEEFARLMIEHDIGTTRIREYQVKRLDSDFFVEE